MTHTSLRVLLLVLPAMDNITVPVLIKRHAAAVQETRAIFQISTVTVFPLFHIGWFCGMCHNTAYPEMSVWVSPGRKDCLYRDSKTWRIYNMLLGFYGYSKTIQDKIRQQMAFKHIREQVIFYQHQHWKIFNKFQSNVINFTWEWSGGVVVHETHH